MRAALEGITVIDLTRIMAGPYATMLLGDLGARVIKIEQPGRGDDTRRWGPPFTANGESAYFLCTNRNKESVTLNLKEPAGLDIIREMIVRADILVENFKVGTLAAQGLGYDELRKQNPGLIYCSITGYGQTGPYQDRSGYDAVIEAEGGIMSINGPAVGEEGEGNPYKVGVAIVDITSGMNAVIAILAALHHRSETGEGQAIDIALFDTQIGWLANVASGYLISGQPPKRYGNGHPSIVPYQTLRAADGWLMVGVGNDTMFDNFCTILGHPQWATDTRFATNKDRVNHRAELIPMIEAAFVHHPVAYWLPQLKAAGIPAGPVNDIPTTLADPQVQARGMLQTIHHPVTGTIPLIGPVPKLSETPAKIHRPPPLLGEHTATVLSELFGYTNEQIQSLAATGVI